MIIFIPEFQMEQDNENQRTYIKKWTITLNGTDLDEYEAIRLFVHNWNNSKI